MGEVGRGSGRPRTTYPRSMSLALQIRRQARLLASAVRVPASAAVAVATESSGQIQGQILQLQKQEQSNPSGKNAQDIQMLQQARTLQLKHQSAMFGECPSSSSHCMSPGDGG